MVGAWKRAKLTPVYVSSILDRLAPPSPTKKVGKTALYHMHVYTVGVWPNRSDDIC